MAANTEFYPYTDDPTAGYQLCTKTLANLTDQIGNELEPSIFLGGSSPLRTMFIGMAWEAVDTNTLQYVHTEIKTFSSRRFGLCDNSSSFGTGEYHTNADSYNPVYPGTLSSISHGTRRRNFNNERWTVKESITTSWYNYHPVVKLLKGCCVGYISIKAVKPLPLEFATLADYNSWKGDSFSGTLEGYLEVKDTYPNIYEISVSFKASTTIGGTNRTKTLTLFFDTGDIPMRDGTSGGAYDGSFSYYQPTGMSNAGVYDDGDGTPKGAKHISYPAVNLVFKGGFSATGINPKQGLQWQDLRYYSTWYILYGIGSIRVAQSHYLNDGGTYPVTCIFFEGDPENILKSFTDLGFAMTTQGSNKAQSGDIATDPTIYVPTYDNNGNVDGNSNSSEDGADYVTGGTNGEPINPNFDPYADGGGEDDEEYPDENPDEDKETDQIVLPDVRLTSTGVFNRTYVLNKLMLQELSDYLWNGNNTTWDTIYEDLKLVGDNRMNSIINCIMFPFALPFTENPANIRIGRHTTGVVGRVLDNTQNIIFDMGEIFFYAKYQNFLDYEPYTQAWLYIPFVGIFKVPSKQFVNHYVKVTLAVDVITGAGQAVIYAGGIPLIYKNCKIGMQIPVTGSDSGYTIRNYLAMANNIIGAFSANSAGNMGGALSNSIAGIMHGLAADNPPIESEGSSSPQCGLLMPNKCYFVVERPKSVISGVPDYGALVGYACYKSGYIGDFTGFSKFVNVKLDVTMATATEKDIIIKLLENGVYL